MADISKKLNDIETSAYVVCGLLEVLLEAAPRTPTVACLSASLCDKSSI